MEDTLKGQYSVSGNKGGGGSAKLLRYPLRSATKSKDVRTPLSSPSTSSASRRGKPSGVTQSVSVLDLSAKNKSAKPPRRLSIPTKSTASPAPKPASNITPVSEARLNRSRNITPVSDVSRSLTRKKFSVLSSASYWLSQIKLSEAAGKNQVSLGFFKLAQVAACENLQLLRDELKSYTLRHTILDLGESAKEVIESYGISETSENVQVSDQGSEDAQSLSSVNGIQKPNPKSSNNIKEYNPTKLMLNSRASTIKQTTNQQPGKESGHGKMQKNFQKQITKESNKGKQMVKKPASEAVVVSSLTEDAITQENKENMDVLMAEEISLES